MISPHSIIETPFSKYSSPPIYVNSSGSSNLYTSKWNNLKFGVLYSFTIVKVGLDISFSKPKCDKKPSVNFVLPAPSVPDKTMTLLLFI